ncbi:MAG: 5-oxoprolinase [Rhodobiaceae bacterium]|nr:5-oxoprolinase [Rhodobiaceae bacterium]
MEKNNWNFWIDKGGTFTDVIALSPNNRLFLEKVLSHSQKKNDDPISRGINKILTENSADLENIGNVTVGTTKATNTLLERTGEKILLIVPTGLRDSQTIGYQSREDIFALEIKKPIPLYSKVIELDIRLTKSGHDFIKPNWKTIKEQLKQIKIGSFNSICVSLIHGWKFPRYEIEIQSILNQLGHKNVTLGHEISKTIKYIRRTHTSLVHAYVDPNIRSDIDNLKKEINFDKNNISLRYMQSNGGLAEEKNFRGINSILSGPAGGVMGAISVGKKSGFKKIITFDMGGTSTDVSHFDGELEYKNEKTIDNQKLQVPIIDIDTIASGGGSILDYRNSRMTVGPKSAGSYPGPMSYGKNGPLTLTDANLFLGKIVEKYFPQKFGYDGKSSLNKRIVSKEFNQLRDNIDPKMLPEDVAEGFVKIAVEKMCRVIRKIASRKGLHLDEHALVSYGGAGGQHACQIAESLEIKTIIINPFSSFLSAYGMAQSGEKYIKQESTFFEFDQKNTSKIDALVRKMQKENLVNTTSKTVSHLNLFYLKYKGTDQSICIKVNKSKIEGKNLIKNFRKIHKKIYGYNLNRNIILDMIQVETTPRYDKIELPIRKINTKKKFDKANFYSKGKWVEAIVCRIEKFYDFELIGPAILIDDHSTIIIEEGWQATRDKSDNILIKKIKPSKSHRKADKSPIMLEIFNNLFMSVAETMGETLQRTAASINIKERLDYSCALFDNIGNLVANAPHIPVHLGSMDDCVKGLIKKNQPIKRGDIFINNSPNSGGTHLPDVTIISPIFSDKTEDIIFYLATRGHHPDIGGIYPGSMTPDAKKLDDEGIIFDNFKIRMIDLTKHERLQKKLNSSKYPARNPELNIQDITAQVAANKIGEIQLRKIIEYYGLDTVLGQMYAIQENAKEACLGIIKNIKPSNFDMRLDNFHLKLKIKVCSESKKINFDFTGSSRESLGNFNAPLPITKAVIIYVLRCLINEDIPLNSGILEPVEISTDSNSIINPSKNAAVSAGNVEVSQALANCIFGALSIKASCQSTMNNVILGNDKFQYYETVCGGQGAGENHDGCDAIQTNMTNSRSTDPEIFEEEYPIILAEISLVGKKQNNGKWKGGRGLKKIFVICDNMNCSLLSNNRKEPPFGLSGGEPGKLGSNAIIRNNVLKELEGNCQIQLSIGDKLAVITPSGGGYGEKNNL